MSKQLFLLRTLLLTLLVIVGVNAWGETKTYSIDFESSTDIYTDWTFTNITCPANDITAHSGTYCGKTGGKQTASIVTKEKVAYPAVLTCYVSKQSDNTTASNWYIQVSTDGTTWTEVKTQSATSMTQGTWVEFTANLSAYTDVYVRVYYGSSTAVRNIDDLTLTTNSGSNPYLELAESSIDFGIVTKGSSASKTLKATVANVSEATVAISGDGASAFSVDKTTLTETGDITVSANTLNAGWYNATLTLSADGTTSVTTSLSMLNVKGIVTMSAASDADIKFVSGSSSSTYAIWAASDPLTANGITLSGTKNSSTSYSYYDGTQVKFYKGNSIVLTPATGTTIFKVEIDRITTKTDNSGTINCVGLTASDGNTTTNTNVYTGNATSAVTFTASDQSRFTAIRVYYDDGAPTTATITLNAACNYGNCVYGTYSNASAWVVPEDLRVSEIAVNDGNLTMEYYTEGDVVPANTGVMVAALQDNGSYSYTINLTSEPGTSKLEDNNRLMGTGGVAITAEQMAAANTDCIFYRLTMHNGTEIGYWWGAADGAAFALAANKAYLAVPKTAAAKLSGLWISDDVSAINAVSATETDDAPAYNLAGQRVCSDAKGIVIKNGRKYINK